jgi:hypothetical protein
LKIAVINFKDKDDDGKSNSSFDTLVFSDSEDEGAGTNGRQQAGDSTDEEGDSESSSDGEFVPRVEGRENLDSLLRSTGNNAAENAAGTSGFAAQTFGDGVTTYKFAIKGSIKALPSPLRPRANLDRKRFYRRFKVFHKPTSHKRPRAISDGNSWKVRNLLVHPHTFRLEGL